MRQLLGLVPISASRRLGGQLGQNQAPPVRSDLFGGVVVKLVVMVMLYAAWFTTGLVAIVFAQYALLLFSLALGIVSVALSIIIAQSIEDRLRLLLEVSHWHNERGGVVRTALRPPSDRKPPQ